MDLQSAPGFSCAGAVFVGLDFRVQVLLGELTDNWFANLRLASVLSPKPECDQPTVVPWAANKKGKYAMGKFWKWFMLSIFAVQIAIFAAPQPAAAGSASQIRSDASAALTNLYSSHPAAANLAQTAKAILVFPNIVKGGFLFGAQYGQGVLFMKGRTAGYYQSTAVSYGLQAGIQTFGYALFLMTDQAMQYVNNTNGWELGVGPSIVVVDEGMAKSMTTTTLQDDVYAFIFDQQGLMAGMGLQGSKISPYTPDE